jgi:hypothetical protein
MKKSVKGVYFALMFSGKKLGRVAKKGKNASEK